MKDAYRVDNLADLERLYGAPKKSSRQESDHIHSGFRQFIENAPFMVLATSGSDGLDASAKGDAGGFAQVLDEKTLLIPERGANGRNDSLRNIVTDPRIALIFLIPGIPEVLRLSGHAHISVDPALLSKFSTNGGTVRSVIVVRVEEVFCQCTRAIRQSNLWSSGSSDN